MNVWVWSNGKWLPAVLNTEKQVLTIRNAVRIRLFDACVSGGTLRSYLQEIKAVLNAALYIDVQCNLFTLPCRSGNGKSCQTVSERLSWQYSPALCCEYACDELGNVLLRDNEESIRQKLHLAKQVAIPYILLSDIAYRIVKASSK